VNGEDVSLDVEIDRVGLNTGKLEFGDEPVAVAPCIQRHHSRTRHCAEDLLGEPVEVTEGISTHQHHRHLQATSQMNS